MIAGIGNQFICAKCGKEFTSSSTEEDVQAERTENGFDNDDCVVVCDDCYKEVMEFINK